MRVLLVILIVGTLFLGVVFPAFVVISGFLAIIFMFTGMFLSLSGAFDGKHVIIRENDKHAADKPEVIVTLNR